MVSCSGVMDCDQGSDARMSGGEMDGHKVAIVPCTMSVGSLFLIYCFSPNTGIQMC